MHNTKGKYENLCKFQFEGIDDCKNQFINELTEIVKEQEIDSLILVEDKISILPDLIHKEIKKTIKEKKHSIVQVDLIKKLQELPFKDYDINNKDLIVGENVFANLKNLYEQYKNNDQYKGLIKEHAKQEVNEILKRIHTNPSVEALGKNIELVLKVQEEFNSILNFEKLDGKLKEIVTTKFNSIYDETNNNISSINSNFDPKQIESIIHQIDQIDKNIDSLSLLNKTLKLFDDAGKIRSFEKQLEDSKKGFSNIFQDAKTEFRRTIIKFSF
jgi:hypothetical protein